MPALCKLAEVVKEGVPVGPASLAKKGAHAARQVSSFINRAGSCPSRCVSMSDIEFQPSPSVPCANSRPVNSRLAIPCAAPHSPSSALYAVFLKEPVPIAHLLDSVYCACGLLVARDDGSFEGSIYFMYGHFGKYSYSRESYGTEIVYPNNLRFFEGEQEFVRLHASADEIRRVMELCEACCRMKRSYNYMDKALSVFAPMIPLSDNVDIYTAPLLHNAQAVLLILRASLDADNALQPLLRPLNSRSVYSTQLHRAITENECMA